MLEPIPTHSAYDERTKKYFYFISHREQPIDFPYAYEELPFVSIWDINVRLPNDAEPAGSGPIDSPYGNIVHPRAIHEYGPPADRFHNNLGSKVLLTAVSTFVGWAFRQVFK